MPGGSGALVVSRNEDTGAPLSLCFLHDEEEWRGFVEIPRLVTALSSAKPAGCKEDVFVALSNEGDVYFVDLSGDAPAEKIAGAGFFSDDSKTFGYVLALAVSDATLFACGNGSQVYWRKKKDRWTATLCDSRDAAIGDCSFRAMDARSPKDIVVGGFIEPRYDRELTVEGRAYVQRLRELGYRAVLEKGKTTKPAEGCLFSYDGKKWKRLGWPSDEPVVAVLSVDTPRAKGRLAVAWDGAIFSVARSGAVKQVAEGTGGPVTKAVVADGNLFIANANAVEQRTPDGKLVEMIALPKGTSMPWTFAYADGALWHFDITGLARRKNGKWVRMPLDPDFRSEIRKLAAKTMTKPKPKTA
jgi:sugar lactone lactonase YvrE